MTEYDNTNTGAVFPANNMELVRQGKINVEGVDGDYAIVKCITKNNKTVFEVYKKVGACFPNTQKREDGDPDMSGNIDLFGREFMVWGRKKVSKSGLSFTSISVAEKKQKEGASNPNTPQAAGPDADPSPPIPDINDDEIPF